MPPTDRLQQIQAHASDAMGKMAAVGIPPTPQNYMLWYHYCSGENPDLARTMDALLAAKGRFDADLSDELFEEFFGSAKQEQETQQVSQRMLQTLTEVFRQLSHAGDGATRYTDALTHFAGNIAKADSTAAMSELLRGILIETRSMVERNTMLERHLRASSEQISELRQSLEAARHEAITDGLTGIANRREFERRLRLDAAMADAEHQPLCLIIADIDHFKRFNDTWGHQIGDQVLRLVARTMTSGTKGQDTAARYGGEEFAIILPKTRLSDALVVAEHIRKDVASGQIIRRSTGEKVGRITLSQGVATYHHGEPLEEFIGRADSALRLAKSRGRNCVIAEGALEQDAPVSSPAMPLQPSASPVL